MNSRCGIVMPGGSTANDIVNALRKASFELAHNIRDGVNEDKAPSLVSEIEGCLHTLVVIDQMSSSRAEDLIDKLHIAIESNS